jgi:hypothetical protein
VVSVLVLSDATVTTEPMSASVPSKVWTAGISLDFSSQSMPCTVKKAFEQAAAAGLHLIAQAKANQPALHHAITTLCDTAAPLDSIQTADKTRRSRDETRTVEVFAPGDSLADAEWDGHIRGFIRVNRDVLTRSAACAKPSVTTGTSRTAHGRRQCNPRNPQGFLPLVMKRR